MRCKRGSWRDSRPWSGRWDCDCLWINSENYGLSSLLGKGRSSLVGEGYEYCRLQYLFMPGLCDQLDCKVAVAQPPLPPPLDLLPADLGKQGHFVAGRLFECSDQLVRAPAHPRMQDCQSDALTRRRHNVHHCVVLLSLLVGALAQGDHCGMGDQLGLLHSISECAQDVRLLVGGGTEGVVGGLVLARSEVVDIEPIVIPQFQVGLLHLVAQLLVPQPRLEGIELQVMAALDYGLALAPQPDAAVGAVTHSELLRQADDGHVVAVPDEDAGLGGADEQVAELAVVHEHARVAVEQAYAALLAVAYLELLHLQAARGLGQGLEPAVLEDEVLPVQLLLYLVRHP